MNIVIAGDGEVGFFLAKLLTKNNHSITVVDPNEELLKMLESEADLLAITGDSTSLSVLKNANVAKADLLISVLHEEKTNILTCILGKKIGAKRTIARVNSDEYLNERNVAMFKDLGIDEVVTPEFIAAEEIVALLDQSAATEVHDFGNGKLRLLLFRLTKESPVAGMTLAEVAQKYPDLSFRAVAIHRRGKTIIPAANDKFLSNDLAYVLSNKPDDTDLLLELSGKSSYSIKNVMIIGAGRIGRKTAHDLQNEKNVKLIDIDKQRCEEAAVELANTLVINGDAHNVQLLEDEGIMEMDAIISVTQDSGINMFSCLLAKKYGVKKVIPLIDNIDYIDIAQNIGIDTSINKKLITASYIARFTMRKVASVTFLSGIDADVLEFVVKKGAPITKRPLKKMKMPEGAIIGGFIRDEKAFIAIGETNFLEDDTVVVLALPHAVDKVGKLFG